MSKQKYFTEEERKTAEKAKYRRYYLKNQEKKTAYSRNYKNNNAEKVKEYSKNYRNTKNGRASTLIAAYNREDKKSGRGKGNLTVKWVVDNIFSKPCAHCGKTGWEIIGCNRLDNSKPHTIDNVEPCCGECNIKYNNKHGEKEIVQLDKNTDELLSTWESAAHASKELKICVSSIRKCCKNRQATAGKYKWMYKFDYEKLLEDFASQEL